MHNFLANRTVKFCYSLLAKMNSLFEGFKISKMQSVAPSKLDKLQKFIDEYQSLCVLKYNRRMVSERLKRKFSFSLISYQLRSPGRCFNMIIPQKIDILFANLLEKPR